MSRPINSDDPRVETIRDIVYHLRGLLTESDRIAQGFASAHQLSSSDFRALLHVVVADSDGAPFAASELRTRLNVSAGAVTYIIDRLVKAGHVRREADPSDRRKVILRHSERGLELSRSYFDPIRERYAQALTDVSDQDLTTTETVLQILLVAMRTPSTDTDLAATRG